MNTETAPARDVSWDQRLLRKPAPGGPKLEYQELKFTLHRKLLDQINLDALASIDSTSAR